MDKDIERYCDEMDEMLSTKGWKNLTEQFAEDINNTMLGLTTVPTWDDACRLQGRLALLSELINFVGIIENIRKDNNADV